MDKHMHIHLVAGARPNFMKIAPLARALDARPELTYSIVHTGQHYDQNMSDVFFRELGIRQPDFHLGAGGGSHARQTARIMTAFEDVCLEHRPDMVLVVGDVDSTLACSVVAKKLKIAVAHVEAGLRSFDLDMPEEINRMVTDAISDYFFVTEEEGEANLLREGKDPNRVHFVGHVMIDNLFYQLGQLEKTDCSAFATSAFKARHAEYGVVTLHRPSNVDDAETLGRIFTALNDVSGKLPLIFPIHPRTRANMERFGLTPASGIHLAEPLPYMEFLHLWKDARVVLTDSGGLQEETTALGIPCLTVRENTERPITVSVGTNALVGTSVEAITSSAEKILAGKWKTGQQPRLWDGKAAERICDVLAAC